MPFNSFYEREFSDFTFSFLAQIRSEIEQSGKEYVLNVNEEEYKNYLVSKYELIPLEVKRDTEVIGKPKILFENYEDRNWGMTHKREVYVFTISYEFTGAPFLFHLKPSTWTMTSYPIEVNERDNLVSFDFKMYEKNPDKFEKIKSEAYKNAFINISNLNKEVENWNRQVRGIVDSQFNTLKEKYIKEDEFFQAIKVKVNPETKTIFNAPPVKRKIIPQLPDIKKKEYLREPTLGIDIYDDILKVLYDAGKNMEKKPSLYIGKDEEGLRDQFIFILETRYDGVTATGETFNRSGKTDILLKYSKDGSNLFVAECKLWHGGSEFQKAINQLLENYLTWSDSKVAILLFVKNKDFSNVLKTIENETPSHKLFKKARGKRGDSSYSYLFCLPQDKNKEVYLEVLAFHFDKESNA